MLARLLSLTLLAGLALPLTAGAQAFVPVPNGSSVTDITPDGSLVVGNLNGGVGYVWRWRVDPAPTPLTGGTAKAISEDGRVVVGSMFDPVVGADVAARWTAKTGWLSLGYLPGAQSCPSRSNAYDVSADGSTVVGLSWSGCDGRGFIWTQATGMQELMFVGTAHNNAVTVSADGSTIAGNAVGNAGRSPTYWSADTTGAILDPAFEGDVLGLSADGNLSVGTMYFSGGWYSAFVRDAASGVITELGALNPGQMAAKAVDISADGQTIVGNDYAGLSREAWVWTAADGIVSVEDRLSALGVTGIPQVFTCSAVSDDGSIVVGNSGPGFNSGYVADLSTDGETWVNVGGGTPGIGGIPLLDGVGSLVGGTPAGLRLKHARESTLTVAWVSLNPTPIAALGGTVHAAPYNNQFLFNTNAAGEINLNTAWPVGLPPGVQVWFQFLIADSTSIHDIVLSNALRATTP